MSLRGYNVCDRWDECGVLVFAHSTKEAKRLGWRTIVEGYQAADFFTDVRVRWMRDAKPEVWGVTEPCVLEPHGCERCERWYADKPIADVGGLCSFCQEDDDDHDLHRRFPC